MEVQLKSITTALESILKRIMEIDPLRDSEARRDLGECFGELAAAINAAQSDGAFTSSLPDLRTKFSIARHAVALHQANWPATNIGEHLDSYRSSASAAAAAVRDLLASLTAHSSHFPEDSADLALGTKAHHDG